MTSVLTPSTCIDVITWGRWFSVSVVTSDNQRRLQNYFQDLNRAETSVHNKCSLFNHSPVENVENLLFIFDWTAKICLTTPFARVRPLINAIRKSSALWITAAGCFHNLQRFIEIPAAHCWTFCKTTIQKIKSKTEF